MLNHMIENLDIFVCPLCEGDLKIVGNGIKCLKCHNHYQVESDIPLLFWPNEWDKSKKDDSGTIQRFYEVLKARESRHTGQSYNIDFIPEYCYMSRGKAIGAGAQDPGSPGSEGGGESEKKGFNYE